MIIAKQYELSQALPESNFQSFHARHVVTGRQVLVHLLTNSSAPGRSLASIIAELNVDCQAQLLDAGEHDGISYLVTVPIPGFTKLQTWLGEGGGAEAQQPRAPTVPRGNDFACTQPFIQPPDRAPFGEPPPPLTPGGPGEFTQTFRRPPEEQQPRPFETPPPALPGGPAPPGDFTLLFRAPNPSGPLPAPSPARPPMPAAPPLETAQQLFRSPLPAPSQPEEPLSPTPPGRPSFFHPSPSPPPLRSDSVDSPQPPAAPTVAADSARSSLTAVWVGVISAAVTLGALAILSLIFRIWR